MPGYITIEQVRNEMQDRTPLDNTIENDLFFSDEEIMQAMERTASFYNTMSPRVHSVAALAMPSSLSFFMDGVCARLYATARHKVARNVITWSAGGTTVDVEKPRLEMFSSLYKELWDAFRQEAKEYKTEINRGLAWGSI